MSRKVKSMTVWCAAGLSLALSVVASAAEYDIAAYVWPAYQPEPRWKELGIFDAGKGEWQSVWEARKPLWGYENEADPKAVEKKIEAAVAHGVNTFIYDWYWYGGRPFLEDALNKGFLGAPNNEKMKFFIMWANHHVCKLWDNKAADKEWNKPIWPGAVSEEEFHLLIARWIGRYFKRNNYYRIEGKPVLMIYELKTFIDGVGGRDAAKRSLDHLRSECVKAGLGGVYIMVCDFAITRKDLDGLGIDGATIYNFVHWASSRGNPEYSEWTKKGAARFDAAKRELGLKAYFAHASVGWDTNPRFPASVVQSTVMNSTPGKFKESLKRAKDWTDRNAKPGIPKLITINSWNEWTEGSYLEPDTRWRFGYLEEIKEVFSKE